MKYYEYLHYYRPQKIKPVRTLEKHLNIEFIHIATVL